MNRLLNDDFASDVTLSHYQEIVGTLEAIEHRDGMVIVELSSGTLRFDVESSEAEICRRTLSGHIGDKVGILRTPSVSGSLVVQVITEID